MGKETKAPVGATIVKQDVNDEVRSKLNVAKKETSMQSFINAMEIAEKEQIKPRSGDLEVINIPLGDRDTEDYKNSRGLLKGLQEEKRLMGYSPKTGVALVLKKAFVEKKKALKDKED